jgi:hypothetical protein
MCHTTETCRDYYWIKNIQNSVALDGNPEPDKINYLDLTITKKHNQFAFSVPQAHY